MSAFTELRARRLLGPAALALAGTCWCVAVMAPALMHDMGWETGAAFFRAVFSLLCHQDPGRSFHLAGSPIAVCIRCSSIYAGFVLGCVAVLAARCAGRARTAPPGRLIAACLAPIALEWLAETSGFPDAMGLARTTTGIVFGFAAAFYVVPAVEELPAEMAGELRRITHPARSAHGKAS